MKKLKTFTITDKKKQINKIIYDHNTKKYSYEKNPPTREIITITKYLKKYNNNKYINKIKINNKEYYIKCNIE